MLFYTVNLPNLNCNQNVPTLLTIQICLRKLGETSMKPITILPEDEHKWREVIHHMVTIRRIHSIFVWCLKNDPIEPHEIRIRHLTYGTRKKFNLKLRESQAISKDLSLTQAYFCLNNNNFKYMRDYNYSQHIDLTLKFEEKITIDKDLSIEQNSDQSKNQAESDTMVIKIEPDFF